MSARLQVRDLTRSHDGVPALDHLDLDVLAGSCLALLGPSGAGKSTALRLIAGLDRPDAGDVLLDGVSVLDVPAERRGAAMVLQRPLLFPHLSVVDNVAFAARVTGLARPAARAQARRYLDLVQLAGLAARRAHELSGGQAQRVALARALAAEPRVLLLDEAFTGLDVSLREDMHELLRTVRAALGPTVLLVTHDPAEAVALADQVAVLQDGRLEQCGAVDALYARPATLAVSRLLGGLNEVPGVVRAGVYVSALGPVATSAPDGPGVLLVRQESVILGEAGRVAGTICLVRRNGARPLVSLDLDDGGRLHAERSPGPCPQVGDRVWAAFEDAACTVLPHPTPAPPTPPPTPPLASDHPPGADPVRVRRKEGN